MFASFFDEKVNNGVDQQKCADLNVSTKIMTKKLSIQPH